MNVSRSFVLLAAVLVAGFLLSLWAQRDIGLADNSDFTRSIFSFSSGPVGLPEGWPDYESDVGQKRFFHYWLPRWNIRWMISRPATSAQLLWVPGILASAAGVSGGTLDLRVISLFPKLLLLGELLLLMLWAWRQGAYRLTLLVTLGIPAVLVFTTTDTLAYLQSFYQETGTLVFILPLFFALVYYRRQPSGRRLALLLVCVVLVTTAKRANAYWPLLVFPFVLSAWLASRPEYRERRRRWVAVGVGLLCTVALTAASQRATRAGGGEANPYQSFFFGALTFSSHPAEHLARFGLGEAADCVGQTAYSPAGSRFLAAHPKAVTYRQVLLTYLRDPRAIGMAVGHVFGNMQDISLEFLGKYQFGDPRAHVLTTREWPASTERFWNETSEATVWNAWSVVKYRFFPTGWPLGLCLAGLAGWFAWQFRAPEATARDLALVGLVATLACPLDMGVAILGEGRADLIKHLFFANLLFDMAAVCFLASVAVRVQQRVGRPGDPA